MFVQSLTMLSLGTLFWCGVLLAGVFFLASRASARPTLASALVGLAIFSLVAAGMMAAGFITLSTS
jgi:hypothetical protein